MRLFRPLAADFEIVPLVDGGRRFDFQCALMSLPHRLKTTDLRADSPYLTAEAALIARWRDRIGAHGFKIGLCWQGNPKGKIDQGRSIPLKKYRAIRVGAERSPDFAAKDPRPGTTPADCRRA